MSDEQANMRSINKITDETKAALKRKSVENIPDRPTAAGMSAAEIKAAFYKPIYDEENSVIAELARVISEANNLFTSLFGKLEGEGGLDGRVTANTEALGILNGEASVPKSVKWLIAAAVAGLIDGAGTDADTLNKLNGKIGDLKTLVGDKNKLPEGLTEKTVIAYIESVAGALAKKSAIKVNGEVQTEWDATDVIKLKNTNGVECVLGKSDKNVTKSFGLKHSTGTGTAWHIPQYNEDGVLYGQTSEGGTGTQLTNKTWVNARLSELQETLLGGDVEKALDTLYELAAALRNNESFAATMVSEHADMNARLNRVDKFTSGDKNKFVVVAEDGSLVAAEITTGGSY